MQTAYSVRYLSKTSQELKRWKQLYDALCRKIRSEMMFIENSGITLPIDTSIPNTLVTGKLFPALWSSIVPMGAFSSHPNRFA